MQLEAPQRSCMPLAHSQQKYSFTMVASCIKWVLQHILLSLYIGTNGSYYHEQFYRRVLWQVQLSHSTWVVWQLHFYTKMPLQFNYQRYRCLVVLCICSALCPYGGWNPIGITKADDAGSMASCSWQQGFLARRKMGPLSGLPNQEHEHLIYEYTLSCASAICLLSCVKFLL